MNSMLEYKGTFNVRIPPEMHRKASLEATRQRITLNQYVMRAIEKSFELSEEEYLEKVQ